MLQESESDDSEEERQTEAEKRKQRALMRIAKRKEASEKKLSLDNLRAPVVCIQFLRFFNVSSVCPCQTEGT